MQKIDGSNSLLRDRSWRRKQDRRIEKKAFKILIHREGFWNDDLDHPQVLHYLLLNAKKSKNNLKMCSCYMCCNITEPKNSNLIINTDVSEIKYFFNLINNKS